MIDAARPRNSQHWFRDLATHDVFPAFSAKVRRAIYTPLGVLSLMAFCSHACGLFVHPQGYVLAGGIAAVMALGIIWPWVNLRGIRARMSFSAARVVEGETTDVRLTVVNRWPWHVWGCGIIGEPSTRHRD